MPRLGCVTSHGFTWTNCTVRADLPTPPLPGTTILYSRMATGDPTLSPLTVTVPCQCDEGEVGGGRGGQHAGLQRDLHVDVVILTSRPRASLRAPLLLLRCPLSLQLLTFCSKVLFNDPDKSQLFLLNSENIILYCNIVNIAL